jgi:penicillin-binding protein 1A
VTPTQFEEILGPNGELLWSRRVDGDRGRRAVPSDIADAMLWMLQQVVKGGTGYGAVPPNRPAAGKTGTSEGGRDLWFIGGVPQLVTGLWLGYDNNKGSKSTSAVAVVAWADYMKPILKDLPVRPFPPKPQLATKFDPLKALKPKPKPEAKPKPEPKPVQPKPKPEAETQPEELPTPALPTPPAASEPAPAATSAPAAPATTPKPRPATPQPAIPAPAAPLPAPTAPPPLP